LACADGRCYYCGLERKLTQDHVVPLSKGGSHSKDNVVAACRSCNSSKGDRLIIHDKAVTHKLVELIATEVIQAYGGNDGQFPTEARSDTSRGTTADL
jgi:5-methylcytosine-specific restriction endonuclease McrA